MQRKSKHRLEGKRDEAIAAASGAADALEKLRKKNKPVDRDGLIQQAGIASERVRRRYPLPDHLVRATRLGNALAALEDRTGTAYGLDPVVTWPRLYPLLSDKVRAAVDDFRDAMDAAGRLAATGVVASLASFLLLVFHSGWWAALALVPLAVAVVSYLGTIPAAIGYGLAMQVGFDLHRFDLLEALHLAKPGQQDGAEGEVAVNQRLSDFLRQDVPVPFTYVGNADAGSADPSGKAANGQAP